MAAPNDRMPQWSVEIAIEPRSKADQEKLGGTQYYYGVDVAPRRPGVFRAP